MTIPKHKKKKAQRHKLRNAATMRAPAARAARPNGVPTATTTPESAKQKSRVPEILQTGGGAAGAAVACAFAARERLMPPVFVTGLVTAVGGTIALFSQNETLKHIGAGIMSAAGAQLGLILIDNHYDNLETQRRIVAAQAERAAADKAKADQAKATRSAESLPPGALEAAYERARARLAMAQAAGQMAPA